MKLDQTNMKTPTAPEPPDDKLLCTDCRWPINKCTCHDPNGKRAPASRQNSCALCSGTGIAEGVKCPRCDGTGEYLSLILPPEPAATFPETDPGTRRAADKVATEMLFGSTAPAGEGVRVHKLKCWPEFFTAIIEGRKSFEWRKNDRDYKTGDVLLLEEWSPQTTDYTGRKHEVQVTYVLKGPRFCVPEDFCVLSITALNRRTPPQREQGTGDLLTCNQCGAHPDGGSVEDGWICECGGTFRSAAEIQRGDEYLIREMRKEIVELRQRLSAAERERDLIASACDKLRLKHGEERGEWSRQSTETAKALLAAHEANATLTHSLDETRRERDVLKQEIATDSWSAEMQRALELIPAEFVKNDVWYAGIGRMAEAIAALRDDAEERKEITALLFPEGLNYKPNLALAIKTRLELTSLETTQLRADLATAQRERDALREEVAKLRPSKQKTHAWLTRMGIPECKEAEGCRAEARSKILEKQITEARQALAAAQGSLESVRALLPQWEERQADYVTEWREAKAGLDEKGRLHAADIASEVEVCITDLRAAIDAAKEAKP